MHPICVCTNTGNEIKGDRIEFQKEFASNVAVLQWGVAECKL